MNYNFKGFFLQLKLGHMHVIICTLHIACTVQECYLQTACICYPCVGAALTDTVGYERHLVKKLKTAF